MGTGRARLAASIATADFGNLYRVVRKLERAGADRLHLDIMDGHFVPNLSFGPDVVKGVRHLTRLPLDVHLQVTEPSRYLDSLLRAGADSVTFHIEADGDPVTVVAALREIRAAGRAAGLAVTPPTPVASLRPFVPVMDIALVQTSEPGLPGGHFLREAAEKVGEARGLFAARPLGFEVHVEGGLSRDVADIVGGQGADILIVGSALFQRGHDIAREIRLVKALADEGWTREIGHGEPPIPRDAWSIVATLSHEEADRLSRTIETAGIPTLVLRTGPFRPDVDAARVVMVPSTVERYTRRRFGLEFAADGDP
jgi:ribulose-phosphate 3-epimerase